MRLPEIPTDSLVFIDANVPLALIFGERNASIAEDFLTRIESGELIGVTSVVVINEIFQRSLVAETCRLLRVSPLTALRMRSALHYSKAYRCKNATFEQRQGQLESYAILDLQLHACKGAQLCEP